MVDSAFILLVGVRFRTAYWIDGAHVDDPTQIALHYLYGEV